MQEELKLRLKTIFEGIDDAERYADAINSVATAEERAARAIRSSARASDKAASSSDKASAAARRQAAASTGGSFGAGPSNFAPAAARSPGRRAATASPGPAPSTRPKSPGVLGPQTRLKAAQEALKSAESAGASSDVVADHRYRLNLAQRQADRESEDPKERDHRRAGQAFMTSRFNAGPFQPLVGRSLAAAIGPQGAAQMGTMVGKLLSGPAGMAAAALTGLAKVGKELYDSEFERAKKGAELTNKIAQTTLAFGSSKNAGVGGLIGEYTKTDSSSAAFEFQQRIGTDPLARNAAAQLGVSDMAAPYGSIDPGKGYMKAIKELAKKDDDFYRHRTGRLLHIEEQTERYRLLPSYTKEALERTGELSGQVNDTEQQRKAAAFDAAQDRLAKNKELFDISRQKGSLSAAVEGMNAESEGYEKAIRAMEKQHRARNKNTPTLDWQREVTHEFWDDIKKSDLSHDEKIKLRHEIQTLPSNDIVEARKIVRERLGKSGSKTPGGASADAAQDANTKATENLTQVIQYLNKNIGETLRTQQSAAPGSLRGGNLYDAYSMGALRYGTLG